MVNVCVTALASSPNLSDAHDMKSDEPEETMKESPKRYINPFLSDEENDKANFWNKPELEHSVVEDEKFSKSLSPCNVPSKYVDKNVLPELIGCFKESGFHVVKDICVDEGLPPGRKILINEDLRELILDPVNINGDKHEGMIGRNLDSQFLKHERMRSSEPIENTAPDLLDSEPTNDHSDMGKRNDIDIRIQNGHNLQQEKDCREDGSQECASDKLKLFVESNIVQNSENRDPDNLVCASEGKLDSVSNSLNDPSTEQLVSGSTLTSIEVFESNNGVSDVDQEHSKIQSPEEEILKRPIAGSEGEKLERSSQTTNTSNEIEVEKRETFSDPECVHELPLGTQYPPNHLDAGSGHSIIANQLQRGEGESSFSMAGPVSGLITYSGPIASSGSISHRSDSSTTSVRSFAFPVLQTEWNTSPVRMAKPDRRRSRKHRGWRKALLCCRF